MNTFSNCLLWTSLATCLLGTSTAQSPLTTTYDGGTFLNSGQVFFDLVVNTTVTVQGIEANTLSDAGTVGSLELWLTNPGTTTFLGNELNASAWTLAASGTCTAAGAGLPTITCFGTSVVLQPGTYGVAINYVGLAPLYTTGNGSVAPGGGGPTTNQTWSTNELTMLAGAAQAAPFTAAVNIPRVFNGGLIYYQGNQSIPCSTEPASHETYGSGCYRYQSSFWDFFDAADAAATLSGTAISMLPIGTGYLVQPGTSISYSPPTAAATTLTGFVPDNDDGDLTVALPSPLTLGDGTIVNSLVVHTNGMISTQSNHASFFNSFTPFVDELLNAPNTAWYSWHDYNINEPGSGSIKTELTPSNVFCITWDGVESYTAAQVNPSTLQFQFDLNSSQVSIVWDSITAINGGAASDMHLIGYSPGGIASIDHGEQDVSAISLLILTDAQDQLPLTLSAAPRPVLGHNVVYSTSNETSNPGFGLNLTCLADLGVLSPAGFDLASLGATGCVANVDISVGVGSPIGNFGGLTMAVTVPIPVNPALTGFDLFSQSIWIDATQNPGGLITSNAIRSRVGSF